MDLIHTLYDLDAIRFALWDMLQALHVSGVLLFLLDAAGFTIYEDFSIVRP